MAPDGGDSAMFEMVLEPRSERFDAEDDRWREQVTLLLGDLQRDVGGVTRRSEPVEGTKGGVEL